MKPGREEATSTSMTSVPTWAELKPIASVSVLLCVVTLGGRHFPARRAEKLNPLVVLQHE